jgi:hypothetical protein
VLPPRPRGLQHALRRGRIDQLDAGLRIALTELAEPGDPPPAQPIGPGMSAIRVATTRAICGDVGTHRDNPPVPGS